MFVSRKIENVVHVVWCFIDLFGCIVPSSSFLFSVREEFPRFSSGLLIGVSEIGDAISFEISPKQQPQPAAAAMAAARGSAGRVCAGSSCRS